MGAWVWGQCSKTCGPGSQAGTRNVDIPAMHGGTCFDERTTTRDCDTIACTGIYTIRLNTLIGN